jgi:hypothetical protein
MNLIKAFLCSTVLIFLMTSAMAQTRDNRLGISAGGGPLDYISNLGNGFNLGSKNSWHGAGLLQVSSYLDQSLDLVFFGSAGDLGASRLNTVGISLKYKFADDRLLSEASTIKPYIYFGTSFNNLIDRVRLSHHASGNYMSLNAGLGARYYFTERIHFGYNLAFGYFLTESTDFSAHSDNRELYIHNALMLGLDLF